MNPPKRKLTELIMTKLNQKKAKRFLDVLNEESAVFIEDQGNEIFEDGTLISIPLGNEMHRTRYYAILSTKKGKDFEPNWKKIVEKEIEKALNKYDSKLEGIKFGKNHALIKVLVSVHEAVGVVIDDALDIICKSGFLRYHYLITNASKPTSKEIKKYVDGLMKGDLSSL